MKASVSILRSREIDCASGLWANEFQPDSTSIKAWSACGAAGLADVRWTPCAWTAVQKSAWSLVVAMTPSQVPITLRYHLRCL